VQVNSNNILLVQEFIMQDLKIQKLDYKFLVDIKFYYLIQCNNNLDFKILNFLNCLTKIFVLKFIIIRIL